MTAATLALLLAASPGWEVNPHRTLVWDGKPWIPVGLEVDSAPSSIEGAVASGVDRLLVSAPASGEGWAEARAALEKSGATFAFRPADPWPGADAWLVAPQHLRREEPRKGQMTVSIPGASEVFAVLARNRDRTVVWSRRVIGNGGAFGLTLDDEAGEGRTLLLYPRFPASRLPDLQERFDARRDSLLALLASKGWGPGLRAVVSPMGLEPPGYPYGMEAKEAGPLASLEFAAHLESKYKSLAAATRAWGLATHDLADFRALARLVPLWSQGRGVASLWDPEHERLYSANDGVSSAWSDLAEFRSNLRLSRLKALCASVRRSSGVPVLLEYESEDAGGDGLGLPVAATNLASVLDGVAKALASGMRGRPRAIWATQIQSDGLEPGAVWAELLAAGVRGAFFRPTSSNLALIATLSRNVEPDAADWSPKAAYFPAPMLGGVYASRVASGMLWLPATDAGREVSFPGDVRGYLGRGAEGLVLWREGTPRPVRLRVGRSKEAVVKSLDGAEVKARKGRGTLEFPLGPDPVVVTGFEAPPAPEECLIEATDTASLLLERYGQWVDAAGVEKQRLQTAIRGIELDPLGSYEAIDEQARRLTVMCAPYAWIPLDRVESGNLATAVPNEGSSFRRAAAANASWPGQGAQSESSWSFTSKVEGEFEAWLSTDASPEVVSRMILRVGGATLQPVGPGTGRYGGGFAWVRFGTAKIGQGRVDVALSVGEGPPASFLLDCVLFAPAGTVPSGRRPPVSYLRE